MDGSRGHTLVLSAFKIDSWKNGAFYTLCTLLKSPEICAVPVANLRPLQMPLSSLAATLTKRINTTLCKQRLIIR